MVKDIKILEEEIAIESEQAALLGLLAVNCNRKVAMLRKQLEVLQPSKKGIHQDAREKENEKILRKNEFKSKVYSKMAVDKLAA